MEELSKSFKAFLYDRATSPLYGTFIMTWCVWNWKTLYVTFVVSEERIPDKIGYIQSYLVDRNTNLCYPIYTTLFVLLVMPIFSVGAKWVSMGYDHLKRKATNYFEKEQLLTKEESIAIRMEVQAEREKFAEVMATKDRDLNEQRALADQRLIEINKTTEEAGRLRFLRAEWGIDGKFFDVKNDLNNRVKENSIDFIVSEKDLGDPAPGTVKKLSVIYVDNGVYHYKIYDVDQRIHIVNSKK